MQSCWVTCKRNRRMVKVSLPVQNPSPLFCYFWSDVYGTVRNADWEKTFLIWQSSTWGCQTRWSLCHDWGGCITACFHSHLAVCHVSSFLVWRTGYHVFVLATLRKFYSDLLWDLVRQFWIFWHGFSKTVIYSDGRMVLSDVKSEGENVKRTPVSEKFLTC